MTPEEADLRTENASLGDLISRMTGDFSTLVRKEMELAKVETKEEITKAGKAGGKLGAAAITGYLALLFLSFAVVFLLDYWMPLPVAFLIVAVVYAIATAILGQNGRKQLKTVNPSPDQTVETLKEDVQWAKTLNK